MQLNLNLTLSIIIAKGMTDADLTSALSHVDSAVTHFKGRYGVTILPSAQSSPNGNVDANKAYLQANGKGRTPIVTDLELSLRVKCPPIDWTSVQARREALLALGYDVFNLTRDKDYTEGNPNGATEAFKGELDADDCPV